MAGFSILYPPLCPAASIPLMKPKKPMKHKRTSCSCSKCKHGCTVMPGYLMPSDLKGYLTEKEGRYRLVHENLLASEGTYVLQVDKRTGEVDKFRIPTLVPAVREDGSCLHYKDGKCGVHKDSPTGCKMFNACAVGKKRDRQDEMSRELQFELMNVWARCQAAEEGVSKEEREKLGLSDPTEDERMYCRTWHYLWQIGKRKENAAETITKYQEGVN